MWRNYFTVGIRALMRSRVYAFINIFGLALGLAACLLILLYVRYELSYDRNIPGSERAFQLQTHSLDKESGEESKSQLSAYAAKTALLKDFPQIERAVYIVSTTPVVIRKGEASAAEDFFFADGPLFEILRFPFLHGNAKTALGQPGSLVLTRTEAQKRFGTDKVVGQTLTLVSRGVSTDYRITGVLEDIPKNSHFKAGIVARFDPAAYYWDQPEFLTSWGWRYGRVYVSLKPGADPQAILAQLPAWEKRNIPTEQLGDQSYNAGNDTEFQLANVRDIHLGPAQEDAITPGNDRRSIITFAIVAVLILVMACINFTNLATARATQRAREVALRKVLGAGRAQLIVQFLAESILMVSLAMVLALALAELVMPAYASFLNAEIDLRYFGQGGLAWAILGLVLLVGVAGGAYPAFYLSRFQPAAVLKANKSSAEAQGSGSLRNALVVAQFAISIGLIICTAVVYSQSSHARTTDPGYERQGLLQIPNITRRQILSRIDSIIAGIERTEGVKSVGRTSIAANTPTSPGIAVQVPGRPAPAMIGLYGVDEHFFATAGIDLLAGRVFEENRPADNVATPFPLEPTFDKVLVARGANVVINETAARHMGFKGPAGAVGKVVKAAFADPQYGAVPSTIVGVVGDSRFRSIREPIEPAMFRWDEIYAEHMIVRYEGDPQVVRGRIEQVWKRIAPDVPFEGKFSEDIVGELYEAEEARAQAFAAFSALAVVIACLGLFGLAAFTAERRTKEIGIRKVFGARVRDIVQLLAWQFSKPVIVANLVAWPVAWWVMRDWLNTFDTRIDLGPTPFVLAGGLALAIALGTIAGHALKVARSNPINALRYE